MNLICPVSLLIWDKLGSNINKNNIPYQTKSHTRETTSSACSENMTPTMKKTNLSQGQGLKQIFNLVASACCYLHTAPVYSWR